MAKQKVRKSVNKRFKITATGKVLHRSAFSRHLRNNKSGSQARRHKVVKMMTGVKARKIKRLICV
jgi:large subunit ribosomal protein L35